MSDGYTADPVVDGLRKFGVWLRSWSDYLLEQAELVAVGQATIDDLPLPPLREDDAPPLPGAPPDHWLEAARSQGPPAHWLALFASQNPPAAPDVPDAPDSAVAAAVSDVSDAADSVAPDGVATPPAAVAGLAQTLPADETGSAAPQRPRPEPAPASASAAATGDSTTAARPSPAQAIPLPHAETHADESMAVQRVAAATAVSGQHAPAASRHIEGAQPERPDLAPVSQAPPPHARARPSETLQPAQAPDHSESAPELALVTSRIASAEDAAPAARRDSPYPSAPPLLRAASPLRVQSVQRQRPAGATPPPGDSLSSQHVAPPPVPLEQPDALPQHRPPTAVRTPAAPQPDLPHRSVSQPAPVQPDPARTPAAPRSRTVTPVPQAGPASATLQPAPAGPHPASPSPEATAVIRSEPPPVKWTTAKPVWPALPDPPPPIERPRPQLQDRSARQRRLAREQQGDSWTA